MLSKITYELHINTVISYGKAKTFLNYSSSCEQVQYKYCSGKWSSLKKRKRKKKLSNLYNLLLAQDKDVS